MHRNNYCMYVIEVLYSQNIISTSMLILTFSFINFTSYQIQHDNFSIFIIDFLLILYLAKNQVGKSYIDLSQCCIFFLTSQARKNQMYQRQREAKILLSTLYILQKIQY